MNEDTFWTIIERAKEESAGDQNRQLDLVEEQLIMLPPEEMSVFHRILNAYRDRSHTVALWQALDEIRETSDDGYEYFRAWLIAQGRATFAEVTQHPNHLREFIDPDGDWRLEGLLYVALEAYEEKTGQSLWDLLQERQEEPYPLVGWEWLQPTSYQSSAESDHQTALEQPVEQTDRRSMDIPDDYQTALEQLAEQTGRRPRDIPNEEMAALLNTSPEMITYARNCTVFCADCGHILGANKACDHCNPA